MTQYYALLSIVFMICVVVIFDRVHRAGFITKFCKTVLLSAPEIEQLRKIAIACEEA